jgi:hypothetical protein
LYWDAIVLRAVPANPRIWSLVIPKSDGFELVLKPIDERAFAADPGGLDALDQILFFVAMSSGVLTRGIEKLTDVHDC